MKLKLTVVRRQLLVNAFAVVASPIDSRVGAITCLKNFSF